MAASRPLTLDRDEHGQVLRLPREFQLPADQVFIRWEGAALVIEPPFSGPRTLAELFASWTTLNEPFGPVEDLPPDPVDCRSMQD